MSQPQNPWPPGSWPPGAPQPSGPTPESAKPSLVNSMAIATELWLVVVLCQIIAFVGQYSPAADAVRDAARDSSSGLSREEMDLMTSTGFVVGVFVVVGVVVTAVSLAVVWLARTGRNWARIVLTFFSAFLVVQTVLALFGGAGPTWTMVPTVIGGVAALGAAYLLLQRETETYCTAMAAYRRSVRRSPGGGLPPGGYPPPGSYTGGGPYPGQSGNQFPHPPPPRSHPDDPPRDER